VSLVLKFLEQDFTTRVVGEQVFILINLPIVRGVDGQKVRLIVDKEYIDQLLVEESEALPPQPPKLSVEDIFADMEKGEVNWPQPQPQRPMAPPSPIRINAPGSQQQFKWMPDAEYCSRIPIQQLLKWRWDEGKLQKDDDFWMGVAFLANKRDGSESNFIAPAWQPLLQRELHVGAGAAETSLSEVREHLKKEGHVTQQVHAPDVGFMPRTAEERVVDLDSLNSRARLLLRKSTE